MTGLSDVIGSWKIMPILAPRSLRISSSSIFSRSRPSIVDRARFDPELVARQQAHHGRGGNGFSRAGFADDAQDLPRLQLQADVGDRVLPVAREGQRDGQVFDMEKGRAHP